MTIVSEGENDPASTLRWNVPKVFSIYGYSKLARFLSASCFALSSSVISLSFLTSPAS
jgi:uncharacterized protein (DUF2132 family)